MSPVRTHLVAIPEPPERNRYLPYVYPEFLKRKRGPKRIPQGDHRFDHTMDKVFVFLRFFLVPVFSFPGTVNVTCPIGKDNLKLGNHGEALGIGRVAARNPEGSPILAIPDDSFLVLPVEASYVFPSWFSLVAPGTFRADFLSQTSQSGRHVFRKGNCYRPYRNPKEPG